MATLRSRHLLILTGAFLVPAAPTAALPAEGPIASIAVSGTNIEAGTSVALTGAVTYQFNQALGLGVELTSIPSLTPETPPVPQIQPLRYQSTGSPTPAIFPTPIIPVVRYVDAKGRATFFTTNLRLEIPTTTARVIPFVVAGGGLGTVRDEFTMRVDYPDVVIQSFGAPVTIQSFRPVSQAIRRTTTDLALTIGGGASLRATRHLWEDADLRYLALIGDRDMHIGRFGGGVSYRF